MVGGSTGEVASDPVTLVASSSFSSFLDLSRCSKDKASADLVRLCL